MTINKSSHSVVKAASADDPQTRGVPSMDDQPSEQAKAHTDAQEAIAEHAYGRYLARGGEHGHDLDDWLEAEQELATTTPGARRLSRER